MEIREDSGKEKEPKLRSINEEFEVKDDSVIIRERTPAADILGKIKFTEIRDIEIKPAGTLYDGQVIFNLKAGGTVKYAIKKYQQEDFEHLKKQILK